MEEPNAQRVEELQASEARYRAIVEATVDAIVTINEQGIILSINPATERLFGYRAQEVIGRNASMLTPAIELDQYLEMDRRTGGPKVITLGRETVALRKDGTTFPIRLSVSETHIEGRRIFIGQLHDITEHKQVVDSLRTSEARFKSMFDEAPLGIAVVDSLNARFYSVNPMFAKIAGRTVEEMTQIDWMEITHPDDIQEDLDKMALMNAGKIAGFQMEKRYRRPDGSYVWINMMIAPMDVEDKTHPRHLLMIEDITERKRMEDALHRQKDEFETIFNTVPAQIWYKDTHNRILRVNDKVCSDLGMKREALEGHATEEFFPLFAQKYLRDDQEVAVTGRPKLGIIEQINTASGDLLWIHTDKTPVKDASGNVVALLIIVEDITRQRQDEETLKQAKEAAEAANRAKDEFIAVLSHELRTPLTPVLATVSALQAQEEPPVDLRGDLELIRRNVEMEATLIDDLLDVTRISQGKIALHRETVDVRDCLGTALEICQNEIQEKRLEVRSEFRAAQYHVWADPVRLRQVFWNLLKNAVKFTPEGGKITLRTLNAGDRVQIEVSDTGIGIEPEMLPRIFNLFEQGERNRSRRFGGLGLGLHIARAVVELHQGQLTAFSAGKSKGATFTVELAIAAAPQEKAVPLPPAVEQPERPLRILLVEDHLDILQCLFKLLKKWGHSVAAAQNVRMAQELADEQPFDLLISDLGLPDGSGLDVMRRVKERYGTPGIALSGYGTEEDIRQSRAAGFAEHLVKPVNIAALRTALRRFPIPQAPGRDRRG